MNIHMNDWMLLIMMMIMMMLMMITLIALCVKGAVLPDPRQQHTGSSELICQLLHLLRLPPVLSVGGRQLSAVCCHWTGGTCQCRQRLPRYSQPGDHQIQCVSSVRAAWWCRERQESSASWAAAAAEHTGVIEWCWLELEIKQPERRRQC